MATEPGDASYSKQLTDTLCLRWSTAKDRPGLALVGALAFGDQEGFEDDYPVRVAERYAMARLCSLRSLESLC
jgi:hypothetical protein